MGKHRTPDSIIQNFLEECDRNEPDYEFDAKVKLMWAQTDYYKSMTDLVDEQIITERLKQKQLRKKLGIDENQGSSLDNRPYTEEEKEEICKKIFGR